MFVDNFDVPAGKIGEAAQRVIERASLEARRRGHASLTPDHLLVALAEVEWDLFGEVMRTPDLNPCVIVIGVEEALAALPSVEGVDVRVAPDTRLLTRLALHRATGAGHQTIEPADLLAALLDDAHGALALVLREYGVDADDVALRLAAVVRELGVRDNHLLKQFELPPYLKQFATNLNVLARQDRPLPSLAAMTRCSRFWKSSATMNAPIP
jgi:ATP-dependent Clp protease ATP-binding subunit ClpA